MLNSAPVLVTVGAFGVSSAALLCCSAKATCANTLLQLMLLLRRKEKQGEVIYAGMFLHSETALGMAEAVTL